MYKVLFIYDIYDVDEEPDIEPYFGIMPQKRSI